MIDINLLPGTVKTKIPKLEFNKEVYSNLIIGAISIFLFTHILIGGTLVFKKNKLKKLNSIIPTVDTELKSIANIKENIKNLQADTSKISDITKGRVLISLVLNQLSFNLPKGVWFRHIRIDENEFELEGSVVSLNADEMAILNKYLMNLKSEKDLKIFEKLELLDAKKRNFQGIDLIDFIFRAKLK